MVNSECSAFFLFQAYGQMWILLDVPKLSTDLERNLVYNLTVLLQAIVKIVRVEVVGGPELHQWILEEENGDFSGSHRTRRSDSTKMDILRNFTNQEL